MWLASAGYLLLGWGIFWLRLGKEQGVYPMNIMAMLFFAGLQQLARMNAVRLHLPEGVHSAAMLLVGMGLWQFVTNWVMLTNDSYALVLHWAGVGLCGLFLGVALRERIYQIIGVGLLAAALAKTLLE